MVKANPKVNSEGKKLKKKVNRDVAKVLNKNSHLQKNLIGFNPYLESLLDPFNKHGARIPDFITYPSATFSVLDRRTLTVPATGVVSICYGCNNYAISSQSTLGGLIPMNWVAAASLANSNSSSNLKRFGDVGAYVTDYPVGMIGGALTDASNLFRSDKTDIKFSQWQASDTTIPDTFDQVRIVSAGLTIQYTGTALDNKGKMTIVFCPRNFYRDSLNVALTIDTLAKTPGARVIPVKDNSGGTLLYHPLDPKSLTYAKVKDTNLTYPTVQSEDLEVYMGGEFYAVADGCTEGSTFQVVFCINYEALPAKSSLNLVQTTFSAADPIALAHANNTIQQTPTAVASSKEAMGLVSGKQQLTQETTVHPVSSQPSTSMIDTVLNEVEKIAKPIGNVVEKVAPLAGLVLSML